MGLKSEILEQPQVLEDLITRQWGPIQYLAKQLHKQDINYVFLAARGTSDHAGLYAKYLLGSYNRLPVAEATPSLFSRYDCPPRLDHALVVGISQSGQSPDIVSVLTEGRRQGARTLAITNDVSSPLAKAGDWVIDISAGVETAVAATKTYTASLMAVALLSVALDGAQDRFKLLNAVPGHIEHLLTLDAEIEGVAERYRYMDQCVVLGRGYNYATAFEWALKLKELTYVVALPYSSADFQHGPVAMVNQGFPVLAVAPNGPVYNDLLALMRKLKVQHQVELLTISDRQEALALADTAIALPGAGDGLPEWLSPLAAIVPAQLFCYHLTRAKRFDTEAPRMLNKVTKTE